MNIDRFLEYWFSGEILLPVSIALIFGLILFK
jgi:hypothetical protein